MSSGSNGNPGAAALFGRLRDLSAEAQRFRTVIRSFAQEPAASLPPAARQDAAALFEEARVSLFSSFDQMSRLLRDLSNLFQRYDGAYSGYGDSFGRIKVAWAQAEAAWYRIVEAKGVHCPRPLSTLVEALDSIAYDCCEITIPLRLREHLNLLPIGDSLDFRGAYSKELDSEAARTKLLTYLNFYPEYLDNGIIDIEKQSIVRIASTPRGRILVPLLAVVVALLGFILIFAATWIGAFGHLDNWPFSAEKLRGYNLAYFFLLAGAVAHVVINLLKQDRAASLSAGALSKWILRLHVRQTGFLFTAMTLCLGSLALPFLASKGISWQTAFFVGYSYDSFLDLFLKRFEDLPAVKSKSELLQFTNNSEGETREGIIAR